LCRLLLPFLLLITALFFSCRSTAEPEKKTAVDSAILSEAANGILKASPSSLDYSAQILNNSRQAAETNVQELLYTAVRLQELLYPQIPPTVKRPEAPPESVFPSIFSNAQAGRIVQPDQQHITFLTTLISCTAVMFTDRPAVIRQALDQLKQAESLYPASILIKYLSGLAHEKSEEYEEAAAYYKAALQLDSSVYTADLGLARILLKQKKTAEAIPILQKVRQLYPASRELLSLTAEAEFQLDNINEASSLTAEALIQSSDDPRYLLLRVKILEAQGNINNALNIIQFLENNRYRSIDLIILKAGLLVKAGRKSEALETVQKAQNDYRDSFMLKEKQAELLVLNGRNQEGLSILEKIIEERPGRTSSVDKLLTLYLAAGQWEKALVLYEKIPQNELTIEIKKKGFSIYFNRQAWTKAAAIGEEIYKSSGKAEDSILYIRALIALKDIKSAVSIIDSALSLTKSRQTKSMLYYLKSLTAGSFNEKIPLLQSALLEDVNNADAVIEIAEQYYKAGDFRRSYRYYSQASTVKPDDPLVIRRLEELRRLIY
jgi:tetratricopeptide (TPR) repeat protein